MHATPRSSRSSVGYFLPALAVLGLPLFLAQALDAAAPRATTAGQVFQGFDGPSGEDLTAGRRDERALWGRNSSLTATTHFPGDGGPGGDFDWTIPFGQTFVLDTSFSLITNDDQTEQQQVVRGYVSVRNLRVEGTLRISGPNPARIAATGNVVIWGQVIARGVNHQGVATFNTGGPSAGTTGIAGGGRGGTASILGTQSTPQGESGYGAFNTVGGGGGGGESGFNASTDVNQRRGSGGGGGRFGPDVRIAATGCAEQTRIGLDVEQGGPGGPGANGALGGLGIAPQPGLPGAGPFVDGDPTNDFWGRMRTAGGATIVGELPRPWAGAGGGGGGDACRTATFPTTPYSPVSDEIGGGGGGGGGSLVIHALGDIVLGLNARIDVSGGSGGGGENTSGINRVGAGGGGGSGGHLVLQAGRTIDLRDCPFPGTGPGTLVALGGQGGEGRNGVGGAGPGGIPTTSGEDSINLVTPFDPGCLPLPNPAAVIGSGGDGGPGLIQLHVPDLAGILAPTVSNSSIRDVIKPPPVGGGDDPNDPLMWDRLVPSFGPDSFSRSQWMPVGGVGPIDLRFAGTDANGFVLTSNAGANARVLRLPAIANGTLASAPNAAYVDVDGRTLVIDAASISDALWSSDPALLVGAELALQTAGGAGRFEVESASAPGTSLRLTVAGAGTPLAGFGAGSTYTLYPRTFRIATDGVHDSLPTSASIRITFQGAPDDGLGQPDRALGSAWSSDANTLESVANLAFLRFQVDFDQAADGSELTTGSPRPSLEFLRVPYLR